MRIKTKENISNGTRIALIMGCVLECRERDDINYKKKIKWTRYE